MSQMDIYLCDVDKECPDYIFATAVIENAGSRLVGYQDADICLFTAGTYLSSHNAAPMEKELEKVISAGKQVIIIKPYGTSYMPLYFRRLGLEGIELLASQISAVATGETPDGSKIRFNRYC